MLLTIIPNLTIDKKIPGRNNESKVTIIANKMKPKASNKNFLRMTPVALKLLDRKPMPLNRMIDNINSIKKKAVGQSYLLDVSIKSVPAIGGGVYVNDPTGFTKRKNSYAILIIRKIVKRYHFFFGISSSPPIYIPKNIPGAAHI